MHPRHSYSTCTGCQTYAQHSQREALQAGATSIRSLESTVTFEGQDDVALFEEVDTLSLIECALL